MTTPTTWRATYAHRHARVEIERPQRPPSTASVLAVIDARIARIEQHVAPDDERPITAAYRSLTLASLRMHRGHVLRGHPASDEIQQLALELDGRTR